LAQKDEERQGIVAKFIASYLLELRYNRSAMPQQIWGSLPPYWVHPFKIEVTLSQPASIAINLSRPCGGKKDRISYRKSPHSIEQAIFIGLDYTLQEMIRIKGSNTKIAHLTLQARNKPFLALDEGADIRLEGVRFVAEAVKQLYPQEKELLWMFSSPDEYQLSEERAVLVARRDFWGHFNWLLQIKKENMTIVNAKETFIWLAELLEELLNQYNNLISRQDLDEQMLQSFIEKHYFMISPFANPVLEKRNIGTFKTDFTLQYETGTTLVELQLNNDPIIVNDKPSAGFADALTQMKDWFQFLKEHTPEKLKTTNGLIVIGRTESFDSNKDQILNFVKALGHNISVVTYSDLAGNITELIGLVRQKISEL
jgi:hypothetical protein